MSITTTGKPTMREHTTILAIRTAIAAHRAGHALCAAEQAIISTLNRADTARNEALAANAAVPYQHDRYAVAEKAMQRAIRSLAPTAMAEDWIEAVYDWYEVDSVTACFLYRYR